MKAYEIVSWKFKIDISYEDQKKLSKDLDHCISLMPGFISRQLFYSKKEGVWTDFVEWISMEHALLAFEKINANEGFKKFAEFMEQDSVFLVHTELVHKILV